MNKLRPLLNWKNYSNFNYIELINLQNNVNLKKAKDFQNA